MVVVEVKSVTVSGVIDVVVVGEVVLIVAGVKSVTVPGVIAVFVVVVANIVVGEVVVSVKYIKYLSQWQALIISKNRK